MTLPAYPGHQLRRGETGPHVADVQRELDQHHDQHLVIDGEYGPATEHAIRLFQRHRPAPPRPGLEIDGVVGPETWHALQTRRPITHDWKTIRDHEHAAKHQVGLAREHALQWWAAHLGLTEQPYGANRDNRKDGITALERRLGSFLIGEAWCGSFLANGYLHARLAPAHELAALASVWNIETLARSGRLIFRAWTTDPRHVRPADGVVLFGAGVHTAAVEKVDLVNRLLHTMEGNTSFPGQSGSQSNGGCSTRRVRSFNDVHGYALLQA